ncbi:MAG: hypothetical protein JWM27_4901 [Gemmatimonadetes bacterium]|nr:hypothetical protein [Gemmatimonadota bacterium]
MINPLKRFVPRGDPASAPVAVGIDLGVRRIKVAVVGEGEGRPELVWTLDVPTPGGILGADGSFDSVAAGRVLAQLLEGAPVPAGARGAVVLPSAVLRVRRLQAPSMDPAALGRLLADDSELRVPGVAPEGLHRAFSPVADTPSAAPGDGSRTLVAAAARRDAVRAYGAAAEAAGVAPRLAAPAVALANLHALLHPEETSRAVLLLHVGSARTELVVVHGGAPLLVLPVVLGTDHLYERVHAVLRGGGDPEKVLREMDAVDGDPAVCEALDEWLARIRGSHRTALGAAEQRLRGRLDELPVRISGGAAEFGIVARRLATSLADPVGVLDPAPGFPDPPPGHVPNPAHALALGAALEARAAAAADAGPAGPRALLLDLALPAEGRTRGAARESVAALARDLRVWGSVAGALLIALGVPAVLQARLARAERELGSAREAYRKEAAAVSADSARVAALQADSTRLAGTLGTLARLEGQRYAWPRLMDAAAATLPRYAWITGLELDPAEHEAPARFRVRAVAPAQDDVSRYERALGGSAGASRVALEGSESLQSGPFVLVGFTLAGDFGFAPLGDRSQPEAAGYHPGERMPPVPASRP